MMQIHDRVLAVTYNACMLLIRVELDWRLSGGHMERGRHLVAVLTQVVDLVGDLRLACGGLEHRLQWLRIFCSLSA